METTPPQSTKSCFDLPKIPKSTLKQIVEKVTNKKEKKEKQAPKEKSPADATRSAAAKGTGKSRSTAKDFEAPIGDKDEYDFQIKVLKKTIGLLSNPRVVNLGHKKCAIADSLTGCPAKYYVFSIPTAAVGQFRKENIKAPEVHFIGSFVSEISMFTYLRCVAGLPRDHPIILHAAEYYGISFANKYSEDTLQAYYRSVLNSKVADGFNTPPMPSQLGRSQKSLRNAFFFREGDAELYDSTKRFLDGSKIRSMYSIMGARFFDYKEYLQANAQAKNRKVNGQIKKAEWTKHVEEVGIEQALADYELLKNTRALGKVSGGKRPRYESVNTENYKKPRLVDENGEICGTSSSTDLSGPEVNNNIIADLSSQIENAKDYFDPSSDEEEGEFDSESESDE